MPQTRAEKSTLHLALHPALGGQVERPAAELGRDPGRDVEGPLAPLVVGVLPRPPGRRDLVGAAVGEVAGLAAPD